jgi:hypothetical protein
MIAVHLVIVQPVVHTAIVTPVHHHDHRQIVPIVRHVRMVTATHVRVHVQVPIVANVALRVDRQIDAMLVHQLGVQMNAGPSVHATRVQVLIAQPDVHTETVTHVHLHVQVQIVQIVRRVHTVINQSVVTIVVLQVTVQRVVHTETETRVRRPVHIRIAENAVTDREIHDQVRIAQPDVHTETVTHAHLPIVHVAKIRTVAIAHVQAMIAMPARLRVTANAVADQIVPEVVSPMIAKNVHVVVLAKSA